MKIGVLIKQVPDTDSRIVPTADGASIEESGLKFVVNPYDEFAIEAALQWKEKQGGTEVVAIGLGPTRTQDALRTALAMGADRAVLLDDAAFLGGDAETAARALAAVVKKEELGLVFTGRQAIDGDDMQVAQMVGELLGWPSVTAVHTLEAADGGLKARRYGDGGEDEVWTCSLPAVVSTDKGINTPRYSSLPGIMKAKGKPLTKPAAAELGLDATQLGKAGAKVEKGAYTALPPRPPARFIDGPDLPAKIKELVRLLREEAKVL